MSEVTGTSTSVFYSGQGMFDGEYGALRAGVGILVTDGRVSAVGTADELVSDGVRVQDLDGVVLPGFVDAHTHVTIRPGEGDQHGQMLRPAVWQTIRGVDNLRRMLQSGVTTARIMTEQNDIDFEFRDAIARGEVAGPRLLVAGPGLSPPGGHGSSAGGVAGVDALREAVRTRAARGADHIKIFTTGGVSSEGSTLMESNYTGEEIAAIVDEARSLGLDVSAHAHGGPGVDLAVDNGIRSIEHGAMLDEGNIGRMADRGTWLTLTNTISFHPDGIERGDARVPAIMGKIREVREYARKNAERIRSAGIPIALGTDSMHGLFGFEIRWMVENGWTPAEALTAATAGGAALIGDPTVGVLRAGARADFVVVDGDPFQDPAAVERVRAVYRSGSRVVDGDGRTRPVRQTEQSTEAK